MKKTLAELIAYGDVKKTHHIVMCDPFGEQPQIIEEIDPRSDMGINVMVSGYIDWIEDEENIPSLTDEFDVFVLVDPELLERVLNLLLYHDGRGAIAHLSKQDDDITALKVLLGKE